MTFRFPSSIRRSAALLAIAVVAGTALIRAGARETGGEDSLALESALTREILLAEKVPSFSEERFVESFGLESVDALAEAMKSTGWKESFVYTADGGLAAKNPYCERFIDEKGAYGVYGKVVNLYLSKKLDENRSTPMLADDLVGMIDAPKICPNWRSFTNAERIKFWTWTFAAVASLESSCGADARAIRGVRGTPVYSKKKDKHGRPIVSRYRIAIGLLQMEKARSDRAWRKIPSCSVADSEIGKTVANLRCGIDIMEALVSSDPPEKEPWPIYPGKGMKKTSYWEKLRRPLGGPIGELMRQYAPCRSKNPKSPR